MFRQPEIAIRLEQLATSAVWLVNPAWGVKSGVTSGFASSLQDIDQAHRLRSLVWMHGTTATFQVFTTRGAPQHSDWDGGLGTHFTGSTWIAETFATGAISRAIPTHGRLAVCLLKASNPRVFVNKEHLAVAGLLFALGRGLIGVDAVMGAGKTLEMHLDTPAKVRDANWVLRHEGRSPIDPKRVSEALALMLKGREPGTEAINEGGFIAQTAMHEHSEIAPAYAQELEQQGYDSILLAPSEREVTHAGTPAIIETTATVFHAHQIELVGWQSVWHKFLKNALDLHAQRSREITAFQSPEAVTSKLGRNEPCWCGSGKKFKKCHGR